MAAYVRLSLSLITLPFATRRLHRSENRFFVSVRTDTDVSRHLTVIRPATNRTAVAVLTK